MVRVELSQRARQDLTRFVDHLIAHEVADADRRMDQLLDSLEILCISPMIGRPVGQGIRELVIGRGSRGYVARYLYQAEHEVVFVLAMRAQRDDGYKH